MVMRSFKRYERNPILTVADLPTDGGYYLLNPGAIKYNGEYLLMVDVFHEEGSILFWIARSRDGYRFQFDPGPLRMPPCRDGWVENGVYDPRITQIGDEYFIVYNSHNNLRGTRLAIARTKDFVHYEHVSLMSSVNNRNGALFPEKIGGLFCCLNRPFAGDEKSPCGMEISFSPDLVFWGKSRPLLSARPCHWDHLKVGAGAPPIRIREGWLEIYHGVVDSSAGSTYSLGAAILDYREPWKVIARSKHPVLFPQMPYEESGRIRTAVFTCNALLENDKVRIYYGAADAVVAMAEMPLEDLVASCFDEYRFMMNCSPIHEEAREEQTEAAEFA